MKDSITKEEFERMFETDENGCYVNLIIPAMEGFPEMNLIGKRPEEYTVEEIAHSKTYRRAMYDRIINNDTIIDYSKIISKEILQNYIDNGELKPLYLVSPDFGGSEKADNIVYVPDRIVQLKTQLDEKLKNYVQEGNKVGLNCDLKYIGKSLVPSMIIINYTINETGENKEELLIWGSSNNDVNNATKKSKVVLTIVIFAIIMVIMCLLIFFTMLK